MRCLPCRRIAAGRPPTEKVATERKHVQAECGFCGVTFDCVTVGRYRFCSATCFQRHRNRRGSGSRPKTQDRGYGVAHQRLRAQLVPAAVGKPCCLCGEVLREDQELHLDHTEDRQSYRGVAHAECNRLDGARRGAQRLRARRLAAAGLVDVSGM